MKTDTAPVLNRMPARIALPEGVREISVGHDVTSSGVMTLVMAWGDASEAWVLSTSHVPLSTETTTLDSRGGYGEALHLVRMGHTSAAAIAAALGGDSPDGDQGNVWGLFDARLATCLTAVRPKAKAEAKAKAKPARKYPPIEDSSFGSDEDIELDENDIYVVDVNVTIVNAVAFSYIAGINTNEVLRLTDRGLPHNRSSGQLLITLQDAFRWLQPKGKPSLISKAALYRIGRYIDDCSEFSASRRS